MWAGLPLVASTAAMVVLLISTARWGGDAWNIFTQAQALLHGRPPSASGVEIYPVTTYVVYAPLGLIPAGLAQPLTQAGCLLALALTLRLWGQAGGGLAPAWLGLLLLSSPALDLLFIDQFNTAAALVGLSVIVVLLRSRRAWLPAGIAAFVLMGKPFGAVPVLPGLAYLHRRTRRASVVIAITLGCVGVLCLAGWLWDRSFLTELVHAGATRPMVGVSAIFRDLFGTLGMVALLVLWAGFEIVVARGLEGRAPAADIAAVLVGLSVIPMHLGGQYVGVFAFPVLVRVAVRRNSPTLLLGYALASSLVTVVGTTLRATMPATSELGLCASLMVIVLPILSAVGGSYLLVRDLRRSPAPAATRWASWPAAAPSGGRARALREVAGAGSARPGPVAALSGD